jgi:hypothetical protein
VASRGQDGWEIAKLLTSEGLYPLKGEGWAEGEATDSDRPSAAARRVVGRIKKRLRDAGLIEKGKPGRPRKGGH